jgi:hypothetical protein
MEKYTCVWGGGDVLKISPIGEFQGIDGREYSLEPQQVIAETKRRFSIIPIDLLHQSEDVGKWEEVGFINTSKLEIRDDGIYAPVRYVREIDRDIFHSLSPTYLAHEKSRKQIVAIKSIGIVDKPNFEELKTYKNSIQEKGNELEKELLEKIEKLTKENIELNSQLSAKEKELKELETTQKNSIEETTAELKKAKEQIKELENEKREGEIAEVIEKNSAMKPFVKIAKNMSEEDFQEWKKEAIAGANYQDSDVIETNGSKSNNWEDEMYKSWGGAK